MTYELILEGEDDSIVIFDPVPAADEEWVAWDYAYYEILRIESCENEQALEYGAEATVIVDPRSVSCLMPDPGIDREVLEEMGVDPENPPNSTRPDFDEEEAAQLRALIAEQITKAEDNRFFECFDRANTD